MSDTVSTFSLSDEVDAVASKALHFLSAIGSDWQAIKNSPLYTPLVQAATMAVTAAAGPSAGGLVNVGAAIGGALDKLAALHPEISTP